MEIAWKTTLEPTWVDNPTSVRALLQSRTSNFERSYKSPNGLFVVSRRRYAYRMETLISTTSTNDARLKNQDFASLVDSEPVIRVFIDDSTTSAQTINRTTPSDRRRIIIDGEPNGDVTISQTALGWDTGTFEVQIDNPLAGRARLETVYAKVAGTGIELPAGDLAFAWVDISPYIQGRMALLSGS